MTKKQLDNLEDVIKNSLPTEAFRDSFTIWVKNDKDSYSKLLDSIKSWMALIDDDRVIVSDHYCEALAYDAMWISFYSDYEDIYNNQSEKEAEEYMEVAYIDGNTYMGCDYILSGYLNNPSYGRSMAFAGYLRIRNRLGDIEASDILLMADWFANWFSDFDGD